MFRFLRLITLTFMIVAMTGCFAGRKDDSGKNQELTAQGRGRNAFDWQDFYDKEKSVFRVSKLDAIARRPENSIESETAVNTHVQYVFTVNLTSRGVNKILRNQSFRVTDPVTKEIFRFDTDENGSGSWTETIEFDATQPQLDPILVIRNIEGLSDGVRGMTQAVFEINPWAVLGKGDFAFRDLTYQVSQLQTLYPTFDPKFRYDAFLTDPSEYKDEGPATVFIKSGRFYIKRMEPINSAISQKMLNTYKTTVARSAELTTAAKARLGLTGYFRGNAPHRPRTEFVSLDSAEQTEYEKDENTVVDQPLGMKLQMEINLDLQRRYILNGAQDFEDINDGYFMVYAALVGSNQGVGGPILLGMSSTGFTGGKTSADGSVVSTIPKIENGNRLSAVIDMYTPHIVNRGDVNLAIKVVPMGRWADRGLKPFGTVYTIGNFANWAGHSGGFTTPVADQEGFDYDDYVKTIKDMTDVNRALLLENGLLRDADEILFSNMNIRFRTVKAGETSTQRTVIFSVTTCPRDGFTGTAIGPDRQFKVLVSGTDPLTGQKFERVPLNTIRNDGGVDFITVQDNSCLSWVDEIAHKYYQRENLVDRTYHIVDGEKEYKLLGYFNPWDEKFGTLGVDARTLSESFIKEIRERDKLPSRFFVGDYSYHTLRFRYEVNRDMELKVKKTVLLNMYPFVKRYSNIINGINGNFPLRDGVYLLKLAYQKDYIDPGAKGVNLSGGSGTSSVRMSIGSPDGGAKTPVENMPYFLDDPRRKTFIHTTKKLIRVENNRVITPVEFEIEDLRTLRIRSNLLIQLEPINQYKLQIVNLFQRLIAEKIMVEIGNLNRAQCIPENYKDTLLDAFQITLDKIALAIPDAINYTSTEEFKNIIFSDGVQNALQTLTQHNLLEGMHNTLKKDIDEKMINRAFSALTPGELADLGSVEDLEAAITARENERLEGYRESEERVRKQESAVFDVLENIGTRIANNTPMSDEENLDLFTVPMDVLTNLNEDGAPENNPAAVYMEAINGAVTTLGATSTTLDRDAAAREKFLSELTSDSNLGTLLNNDFTIDPAVTLVSDLDYLIDRKAGIIRRTFIGPLTLVAADNKNTMNATDAIDYNNCAGNQDCSGQTVAGVLNNDFSFDYAKSPYFGYQGQFENCHVDDFIIEDHEEEILYQGWSECVRDHVSAKGAGSLEVKLGHGFHCDYRKTSAYQKRPEIFLKYFRLSDEKDPDGDPRQCRYRDVWLQKHFAQKRLKKVNKQISNFLRHPENTARLLTKDGADNVTVDQISSNCREKGFLSEDCFEETHVYDLRVEDLAQEYVDFHQFFGGGSINELPQAGGLARLFGDDEIKVGESVYKQALVKFYDENRDYFGGEIQRSKNIDPEKFAQSIYETLMAIAAPTEINLDIARNGGLPMAMPADFGPDVQKFMCNILIPRAHTMLRAKREEMGVTLNADGIFVGNKRNEYIQLQYELFPKFDDCFKYAEETSSELPMPFNIERQFKVYETGRYFFRGGKSINFNTGQGVSVGHNKQWQNSYGLDPYNAAKGAVKDAIPWGKGVGGSIGKGLSSFVADSIKLMSYSSSESNSQSDGLSMNTATHLSMQAAQLDLELLKYRRCVLVKWNPEFLNRVYDGANRDFIRGVLPLMGNIFVCGAVEEEPFAVKENYYYLTQHFTEGDLLDSGSLLNNPWLLSLRGYRDMISFVTSLYPSDKFMEEDGGLRKLMGNDWDRWTGKRDHFVPVGLNPDMERTTFKSELQAWQIMAASYAKVSPAFPGMFTQLSHTELTLPDWPWVDDGKESQIERLAPLTCPKP